MEYIFKLSITNLILVSNNRIGMSLSWFSFYMSTAKLIHELIKKY